MINMQINPWHKMKHGSRRRVEYETNHDYFWLVDVNRNFGFYMKLELSEDANTDMSLNGIDIAFEQSSDDLEIFLTLERNEDWEVFYVLCFDLIYAIDAHESDSVKVAELLGRLEKWKRLLANRRRINLSLEQQMGIFSELYCLKNVIAKRKGFRAAIDSWVGMEKDKQDFNLDTCVIEVKSHITTKGNVASISSASQLYSEKDKFYLMSYGLTLSDQGQSIDDLFEEVQPKLTYNENELLLDKLFDTGWIPYHSEVRKYKFIVDSETAFEVDEGFPKIIFESIDPRILAVKYKLDLSKCSEYVCSENDIWG